MPLKLTVNGQSREFADLTSPVPLIMVIAAMDLKGDRVAVEHNGEIAHRARWEEVSVASGDRLEVVHFVGGGIFEFAGSSDNNLDPVTWQPITGKASRTSG
jgi:sulfur carrier protein